MDELLCIRLSEGGTEFGNVLEVIEGCVTQLFDVVYIVEPDMTGTDEGLSLVITATQ